MKKYKRNLNVFVTLIFINQFEKFQRIERSSIKLYQINMTKNKKLKFDQRSRAIRQKKNYENHKNIRKFYEKLYLENSFNKKLKINENNY